MPKSSPLLRLLGAVVLLIALLANGLCAERADGARDKPSVAIASVPTDVPGESASGRIKGTIRNGDPAHQKIVIYAFADGKWWVQPFTVSPFTDIAPDGRWSSNTHGGKDFAAVLVLASYDPAATLDALPAIGGEVLAVATKKPEDRPYLTITSVPLYTGTDMASDPIKGLVANGDPDVDKVVVYARVADQWQVQPGPADALTPVGVDGKWERRTRAAKNFLAVVVRPPYVPPATLEGVPQLGGPILAVAVSTPVPIAPLRGSSPTITITNVPLDSEIVMASDPIKGTVSGGDPKTQKVVIYAHAGNKWWVQPYALAPLTDIGSDGTWESKTHGGRDFAAFVVNSTYVPAAVLDTPPALGGDVLAKTVEPRPYPIQIRPWFRPAMIVGSILFAVLLLALIAVSWRLRRYAGGLEQQVEARTAELREDIARRERSEKVQRAIALISEAALSAKTLADFYPALHLVISELMPTRNFFVALMDTKHDEVQFPYYRDEKDPPPPPQPFGRGLTEHVVHTGKPLLVAATDIARLEADGTLKMSGFPPAHWLGVPLRTQEVTLGVMAVQTYSGAVRLTEREKDILMLVSYPVANAIERKQAEQNHEKLEEQLAQAQKMESIGRLAGGVAHDFNNMLQAIMGNASLALESVSPTDPLHENLEEIRKAAERSSDLTRQLLAFARKQPVSPKVIDLNAKVSGLHKMLQRLISEQIQLVWLPARNLWLIEIDPSQVDQILMNLVVNARDSIDGFGKITIETANVLVDHSYAELDPEVKPGDYVQMTVTDTGRGMDREVQAHLFEPFFTTKGLGKGTGLGLATVYGIVRQNGGLINVYSELGRGTTFKIYLPRRHASFGENSRPISTEAQKGTETVLLVEDEPQILRVGSSMLERHGYTVLCASRPTEALRIVETHPGQIDLLITDVMMPEMNGRELHEQVRQRRPKIGCLFISGYTAGTISDYGNFNPAVHLLQKPFMVETLTRAVRTELDRVAVASANDSSEASA